MGQISNKQFPINNFGPGTQKIPAENVPAGTTQVTLSLDRSTMTDPALLVNISLDFSPDGGTTWASENPGPATNPYPISADVVGGVLTDRHGNTITESSILCPIPPSAAPMIRGSVVVSGAPLTTVATVTLS